MQRIRIGLLLFSLVAILSGTAVSTRAAPLFALALPEGRTHDQAHNTGHIDWSGPVQYAHVQHRDMTSLPPEEGGTYCGSGCWEWVTRLGNGGVVSGSFDRDVSYFEVMVGFTPDPNTGNATLRACSAVKTWNLQIGSGLPGFVSVDLAVPAGCRSWSLTASDGYVDFRSIDVYYIGLPSTAASTPPPTVTRTSTPTLTRTPTATITVTSTPTITNTPTLTFTPSFMPTNTATTTFTFTPTFTPTNMPSPTPTPLPPQIMGVVACDLWGDGGWCRGNETLELSAGDPQGLDVTITGDLSGEPFTCGNSCDLPLPEGTDTARYTVISTSGQTASGLCTWQRDGTPPDLEVTLPPVDGNNGWHVSEVDLSATATDSISGLASLLTSTDDGVSWVASPIHFTDGTHSVLIHARDVAGNEVTASSVVIRVDTVPPVAHITSHSNGDVVQGDVRLAGSVEDGTSGPERGEISTDGGNIWRSVSMDAGEGWSSIWHSSEVPNGEYTIQMRGRDRAGNLGDVVSVRLAVDNAPPAVSITEQWWIWEAGSLKVSPNHFPIAGIQVMIRDPQNRWPALVMELKPGNTSYLVKWDRHFGEGTQALSGEYLVMAVACDINGLCGRDTGRVVIPAMPTITASLTPSPTVTSTLTPSATSIPTRILPSATPLLITPIPEITPESSHSSIPLWQMIGLLGLFVVIASASVVDPRPNAIDRLCKTFRVMSVQGKGDPFDNKQNYKDKKDK